MFQLAVRIWVENKMIYPVKFSVMYDVASHTSSVRAFVKNDKFISTDYMLITPFDAVNGTIFEKDIIAVDGNEDILRVVEFNMEKGIYQAINIMDETDILQMTSKHKYETAGNLFEDLDLLEGSKYEKTSQEDINKEFITKASSKPDTEDEKKKDNEAIEKATKSKENSEELKEAFKNDKKEEKKDSEKPIVKPEKHNDNNPKQQAKNKQEQSVGNQNQQNNKKNRNEENLQKNNHADNSQHKNNKQNKNKDSHNQAASEDTKQNSVKNNKTETTLTMTDKDTMPASAEKPEKKIINNKEEKQKNDITTPVVEDPVAEDKHSNNENLPDVLKESKDGQMTFLEEPDESDYFDEPKKEKSALKNNLDKQAKAELHFISDCVNTNGSYVFSVLSRNMEETFFGEEDSTDVKKIVLQGLIDALASFEGNFNITVFTESQYVVYPFLKGWINKWKNSNWFKNDTDRIQNFELWAQLLELSEKYNIKWEFVQQPTEQMKKCKNVLKMNKR